MANIKCELLNDFATANTMRREAVLADEAALSGGEPASPAPPGAAAAEPAASPAAAVAETDLDAEFERLVAGIE